ncbi:MAG: hypothetical protein NE328_04170 [Lentisphaeraceae bacterium]|nr:hypothetical protein [Lentisphaeraceae bacterium]
MDDIPEAEEKSGPEELTCPEWMMTMGDCMSLLLTFFVLLLTFSTTSKSKLMDVVGVMKGAFSIMKVEMVKNESAYNDSKFNDDEIRRVSNSEDSSSLRLTSNAIQRKFNILESTVAEIGFKNPLTLTKLDDGVAIEIPADEFFVEGTYTLTFEGKKIIQEVANIASNIRNEVRIISNLDKIHMSGKMVSKEWLNAYNRNYKLVRMLVDDFNLSEFRFSIGVNIKKPSTSGKEFSKISIIFVENLTVKQVGIQELLRDEF